MNSAKYRVLAIMLVGAAGLLLGGCATAHKVGHKSQGAWTKIQHADSKDKDYTRTPCRCHRR
jgi:hypothetical protein